MANNDVHTAPRALAVWEALRKQLHPRLTVALAERGDDIGRDDVGTRRHRNGHLIGSAGGISSHPAGGKLPPSPGNRGFDFAAGREVRRAGTILCPIIYEFT